MTIDYDQLSDTELYTQTVKALYHDPVCGEVQLDGTHLLSLVKRAIEERYECWNCMWIGSANKLYCFGIHTGYEMDERAGSDIVEAWGETEERAGCVAFLRAVALGNEQSNDNQKEKGDSLNE